MQHKSLHVVKGDILDRVLLDAVQQHDAVSRSLGTKISLEPVTLLSEGTKNLVQVMERHGDKRLICITGLRAGGSKGHGGFYTNHH